ncbi:hypothetical protein [Streptomyces sp. f150]|uniref:hypothetical protein n=1 Tax=Streptomyces sp. f150 TaxID=1827699 RepID=UPI000BF07AB6|nr:hypothetical protein [Streptomyces sp. f150]
MADQPDETNPNDSSRMSQQELYEYNTSIVAGSEDYSDWGNVYEDFPGWYDAHGHACRRGKFEAGPDGKPIPVDPDEPPPVYRP